MSWIRMMSRRRLWRAWGEQTRDKKIKIRTRCIPPMEFDRRIISRWLWTGLGMLEAYGVRGFGGLCLLKSLRWVHKRAECIFTLKSSGALFHRYSMDPGRENGVKRWNGYTSALVVIRHRIQSVGSPIRILWRFAPHVVLFFTVSRFRGKVQCFFAREPGLQIIGCL